MNLARLKFLINTEIAHEKLSPEHIPVLITLSDSSVGARASIGVTHADIGMDWEAGEFRIEPMEPLVLKSKSFLCPAPLIKKEFGGLKYHVCSVCLLKVAKGDSYCKHCGQKLQIK